ncbi:MAG: esterase-like activity of phytase family protein [Thermoleophilia bacterium]
MSQRPVRRRIVAAAALATSLAVAAPASAGFGHGHGHHRGDRAGGFDTIAHLNVPDGGVAEIVTATPDGKTLLYSDAGKEAVGVVDVTDPASPAHVARIAMPGTPTSVAVTEDGSRAVVAVQTLSREEGKPPSVTPGKLVVIDLATDAIVREIALGNGPDSVALTRIDGVDVAVIAIENEPLVVDAQGNATDDDAPGVEGDISGPGYVQVVALDPAAPRVIDVPIDLTGTAGALFPDDPQPEFVSIRGTTAAVTIQENNAIALIDLRAALAGEPAVAKLWSAGVAGDRPADLVADDDISFTQVFPRDVDRGEYPDAGARTPDAIAWSADGRYLYTADEGETDFTGSRGWTAFDARTGEAVWEAEDLERIAASFGHYPDSRSDAKGLEIEGITTGVFGGRDLAFVGSERGSFLAVYDLSNPRRPRFLQLLPTGVEPEGILAIPSRGLVVATAEGTGDLTIFRAARHAGSPAVPQVRSKAPWAALSGLAADLRDSRVLWSVPDNALPSALYRIELRGASATLTQTPITIDGERARLDLEGIAVDTSRAAPRTRPGFWLAHEGNAAFGADGYSANALVQVDARGRVLGEVPLPAAIDSPTGGVIRSNGFEGVAVSDDGRYLLAAIQRDYAKDATIDGVRYTRIARYDLARGTWDFFLYPLESTDVEDDWIGLSEITSLGGDRYAVIERDKLAGGAARIKRVYSFSLRGVTPTDGAPIAEGADLAGKVLRKSLLRDALAQSAPFEKLEGFAVARDGRLWAAIDNDGGLHESRLFTLGRLGKR